MGVVPHVERCCVCCSLRVGMLYISVLAIINGSLSLTLIEKNSDFFHSALRNDTTVIPHDTPGDRTSLAYAWWHFRWHNRIPFGGWRHISYNTTQSELADRKVRLLIKILKVFCYVSMLWIVMGVVLLISALMGEQCLVYVFTVGTFLLVLLGILLAIPMVYTCLVGNPDPIGAGCMWDDDACLVRHLDWLSGSACLLCYVMYMFLWIYFIVVANSYCANGDTD